MKNIKLTKTEELIANHYLEALSKNVKKVMEESRKNRKKNK